MLISELTPELLSRSEEDAWVELASACQRHDLPNDPAPTRRTLLSRMLPRADERIRVWVAREENGFAGGIVLALFPGANEHLAVCRLEVHPALRRRGVGRVLYQQAVAASRNAGRRALVGDCLIGGAGEAFAAALGARPVLTDLRSLLRVADIDHVRMRGWAAGASAKSSGFSLVRWVDTCPEPLVGEFLRARTAMDDVPIGELELNTDHLDAVGLRRVEANAARRGERLYTVAVREESTGRLGGYTTVHVLPDSPWAAVGTTAVLPAYRGRGFGLWLKADMVWWLTVAEPELTGYVTGNDSGNVHMRRINDLLGYRVLDRWQAWQLSL